jgi:hypothetical protein
MSEGEGKKTPISPGIIARVTQSARYIVSGVSPTTWFGPSQPQQIMAPPEVAGRRFDYPTGYNLTYTPGGNDGGGVSFTELRALADNCDVLRSVIETRKDQLEAMDWNIKLKPDDNNVRAQASDEQMKRVHAITAFLQKPD